MLRQHARYYIIVQCIILYTSTCGVVSENTTGMTPLMINWPNLVFVVSPTSGDVVKPKTPSQLSPGKQGRLYERCDDAYPLSQLQMYRQKLRT